MATNSDGRTAVALGVSTIFFVQLAAYLEEWMFKHLPGFDFFWTVALVELVLFAVCAALAERVAEFSSGAHNTQKSKGRTGPFQLYLGVAATLAAGTGLGKVAFRYLNYATGTVLKSMKLFPVMAISYCWLGYRYSAQEVLTVVLMIVSAALFGLGERELEPSFHPLGIGLSLLCLLVQAVQSNLQDRLLRGHGASVHEAMLWCNGLGAVFVLCLTVGTAELPAAVAYFATSPVGCALLLLRSLAFYVGALLYTMLLRHSGAVVAVAVTTLRKSLTVLLSFVFFPKVWSPKYGWGIVCLFAAFAIEVHVKTRSSSSEHKGDGEKTALDPLSRQDFAKAETELFLTKQSGTVKS